MPQILDTAAVVEVSIFGVVYSKFNLYPKVRKTDDGLDIIGWAVKNSRGRKVDLYDTLLASTLHRSIYDQVCIFTFEREDIEAIEVKFDIEGDSWTYPMRAIEHDETVYYEIEIEGEWMDTLSTYIGDVFPPECFPYAENAVMSTTQFGNSEEVYAQMI